MHRDDDEQGMTIDSILGRHATLKILRFVSPGAILKVNADEELLLIGKEIPEGAQPNDEVDVFVYLDSESRPIATTRQAKLEVGEVAFLRVTEVTKFGAFVDWGVAKDLLVPFKEQTTDMQVGVAYAIGVYIDETGRLAGTMKVSEMLDHSRGKGKGGRSNVEWKNDEWVEGEAWRQDQEIGTFIIVERAFVGLIPKGEPHSLKRGDAGKFRVTNILPDGKIELSLRGHAHEEIDSDAQSILDVLSRPNQPRVSDKSSPEEIRDRFGLSKKAFKRAVGRLLKERKIAIDAESTISLVK